MYLSATLSYVNMCNSCYCLLHPACSFVGSVERHAKQANLRAEELKLPAITGISSELCREGEWDNALTCHAGSNVVRTWNVQNRVLGKHKLVKSSLPRGTIATVCKINYNVVCYVEHMSSTLGKPYFLLNTVSADLL